MNILVIIPTLDSGGAQRAVSNMLLGLPEGYNADIVINDDESVVYPYKGNIITLGLHKQNDRTSLLYQLRVFFRRLFVLRKLKKRNHYAVAYSFMDSANIANILTGKKYCKTVVSIRTNLAISAKNNWKYRLLIVPLVRRLYKHADKVVTVSRGVQKELVDVLRFYPDNIMTIYNGYESDRIILQGKEPISGDLEEVLGNNMIVTMGRLSKVKGQWYIIRAMRKVVQELPDARLVIMGEGQYDSYLEKLVSDLNLSQNVLFLGFRDNPFSIIRKAKLFIMTSLYEGFPNSLIEALSLGVPCIATDFKSGAREILAPDLGEDFKVYDRIDAKYGILTPLCDGNEYSALDPLTKEEVILAEAIIDMLRNNSIRQKYIEKSREVVERFSIDKMVNEYISLAE